MMSLALGVLPTPRELLRKQWPLRGLIGPGPLIEIEKPLFLWVGSLFVLAACGRLLELKFHTEMSGTILLVWLCLASLDILRRIIRGSGPR